MIRLLVRHVGRRGAGLVLFGLVWIVYGISMFTAPPTLPVERHGLYHLLVDVEVRGAVWIVTGLIALACAWRPDKTLGFVVLRLMPFVLVSSYLVGWGISLVTVDGSPRGWATAVVWSAVMNVISLLAGWQEPVSDEALSAIAALDREDGDR